MIEQFIGWIASQIPGLVVGFIGGVVAAFFYIQHKLKSDPNWVENLYQKQRSLSMNGTEAIERENADLKAQLAALDFDKKVTEKVNEVISKLKG